MKLLFFLILTAVALACTQSSGESKGRSGESDVVRITAAAKAICTCSGLAAQFEALQLERAYDHVNIDSLEKKSIVMTQKLALCKEEVDKEYGMLLGHREYQRKIKFAMTKICPEL